jgi:hypothetical protein
VKYKWEMMKEVEIEVATGQCMMQFAQNAVSHVRFPLNQVKEDRFTAEIATNQNAEIDSNRVK